MAQAVQVSLIAPDDFPILRGLFHTHCAPLNYSPSGVGNDTFFLLVKFKCFFFLFFLGAQLKSTGTINNSPLFSRTKHTSDDVKVGSKAVWR